MREILYHRHAVRYLKRMPEERKEQIKSAIAQVAEFSDVPAHPSVKVMRGEWKGCLRLRVGGYRVIFRIADCLEILHVGPRGDIY
jgi:mRNA-degrading endonuclease RelE of RelBE toxin-antitoxin system